MARIERIYAGIIIKIKIKNPIYNVFSRESIDEIHSKLDFNL